MELYSGQINKLIDELAALPGIGSKSAQRLAFHLINMPKERVDRLANVMIEARANVRYCKECYTLTDKEICPVCANPRRDHHTIMVVLEDGLASDYFKGEAHEQNKQQLEALLSDFSGKEIEVTIQTVESNRQFEDNYVDLSKVINMEIDEEE